MIKTVQDLYKYFGANDCNTFMEALKASRECKPIAEFMSVNNVMHIRFKAREHQTQVLQFPMSSNMLDVTLDDLDRRAMGE